MTYETALQKSISICAAIKFPWSVASSLNAYKVTMVTKFLFWHCLLIVIDDNSEFDSTGQTVDMNEWII